MKTEDLITLLATGSDAVDRHAAARRFAVALGWGAAGTVLLMALLLPVRADLAAAALLPMFWIKAGFVGALAGASLFAALRLSRPGARIEWVPGALVAPVLVMWAIAAFAMFEAEPLQRSRLFLGETWQSCPLLIAMLSVPVFIAVMWAMKGLAPTRPVFAGFMAGLLAGATAALAYCLHCPEMGAPFVGFWYLLGMLITAGVGALLGPYLLRW